MVHPPQMTLLWACHLIPAGTGREGREEAGTGPIEPLGCGDELGCSVGGTGRYGAEERTGWEEGLINRNTTRCHLGKGTVVGTVQGGRLWIHFKAGHAELADGQGLGREREKKPRTMSGFLGSFKLRRLPFPGTILQAARARLGGGGGGWGGGWTGDQGSGLGRSSFSWLSDILGKILFSNY